MLYFPDWRIVAALTAMVAGFAFAVPDVLAKDIPEKTNIVAELDSRELIVAVIAAQMRDISAALRTGGVGFKLVRTPSGVTVQITEPADADKANDILKGLLTSSETDASSQSFALERSGPKFTFSLVQTIVDARIGQAVEQTLAILRDRLNTLGITDALVQRQDAARILIQLPGNGSFERVGKMIGERGTVAFRTVCESQPAAPDETPPAGCASYPFKENPERKIWVQIASTAGLDNSDINDASVVIDSRTNEPVVNFRFSQKGTERFGKLTTDNVGKPFAIIHDQRVISAPRINEPILGGGGQISGYFTVEEANALAMVMRSGALPAQLNYISVTTDPGGNAEVKKQYP